MKIQAYFTNNSSSASGRADKISITSNALEMPIWTFSRNHSMNSRLVADAVTVICIVSGEETDSDMPSNVVCNDTTTTLLKNLTQPI